MDGHQKRAIDLGNLFLVFIPRLFDLLLLSFSLQLLELPLVFLGEWPLFVLPPFTLSED